MPPFPDYYRRMKALNARGPRVLNGLPGLVPVPVARARELLCIEEPLAVGAVGAVLAMPVLV